MRHEEHKVDGVIRPALIVFTVKALGSESTDIRSLMDSSRQSLSITDYSAI